jgi:hypothetical protein
MPGNPIECHLHSLHCSELAESAATIELRQKFTDLAETWKQLAAELRSDQALRAIGELEFTQQACEPYETLPLALGLRSLGAWSAIHSERALSELYPKQYEAA